MTVDGGGLRGGSTKIAGNVSSQFVSALLLVAPRAHQEMNIHLTTTLESAPYVLMTLDVMQWFGVSVACDDSLRHFEVARQPYVPTRYPVEGDWSSASYLLALGALAGRVQVDNLKAESLQADRIMADILKQMGASVRVEPTAVTVAQSPLRAVNVDLSNCIDLLPTVAVLAAAAEGTSTLTGIRRARTKESDRVAAVREGLERLGITAREAEDSLSITGGPTHPAVIDSHGDHRIAMAFAALGVARGGTTIEGAECVAKTYPDYWHILRHLGGEVTLHE